MYQEVEVNGEVIEFPESMSDDEISTVLQKQFKQQPEPATSETTGQTPSNPSPSVSDQIEASGVVSPKTEEEYTTAQYAVDQIKLRYGESVDLSARLGAAFPLLVGGGIPGIKAAESILADGQGKEKAEGLFGYQGLEPRTEGEKLAGVVAAAAADPVNILMAPIGVSFTTGKTLLRSSVPYAVTAIEWLTGTAAETVGYYAAEQAAELYKGTEKEGSTLDHLTRFASGFLAGGTVAVASPARLVMSGAQGVKQVAAGKSADQGVIVDLIANSNVKALVDQAVISEGQDFSSRLQAITKLQEKFPDLVLPVANVVGDNAIIKKEFRRLYATDNEFRQKYDNALKEIQTTLDGYVTKMRGEGVDVSNMRSVVLSEAARKQRAIQEKQATKLGNIEEARAKVAARYEDAPTSEAVSKAAENVAQSAEKAARDAASIEYDKAFQYAEAKGLQMEPNSVATMWQTAKALRAEDLFRDAPSVYNKIKAYWGPQEVSRPEILGPNGKPLSGGTTLEFSPASIKDMDSLKREINRVIRTTTDPTRKASLNELKDALQAEIVKIDPEFAAMYHNADYKFFETVGLPTSAEGYRSYDAARLATETAGALTKPEQIRDYLSFVGPAGEGVIRDAFLLRARASILKDGDVDPSKLRAFLAKNKEALNEVPAIRAMFEDDIRLVDRINRGRAKIQSNYNVYAAEQSEGFFKTLYNKNIPAISQEVLRNPGSRTQYLQQIEGLAEESKKLALTGLRQGLLDQAMAQSDGTVFDFIKANKDAFADVFGNNYLQNLENLGRLADIASARLDDLVAPAIRHSQETRFKKYTNLTEEETIGTVRNQILSPYRKMIHLASKAFIVKSNAKADKALADVLLDTKALDSLQTEIDALLGALEQTSSGYYGKQAAAFAKGFASKLGGYITAKGTLGVRGADYYNDDLEAERNMLPTMEEDDWLFAPKRGG